MAYKNHPVTHNFFQKIKQLFLTLDDKKGRGQIMAINFSPIVLANKAEKRSYEGMKLLQKTVSVAEFDIYASEQKVGFEKNGSEILRCAARYIGDPREFICYDPKVFLGTKQPQYLISWSIPANNIITEVRYGDIDRDGDIDIAVKLTDGAIYVFHNLSK